MARSYTGNIAGMARSYMGNIAGMARYGQGGDARVGARHARDGSPSLSGSTNAACSDPGEIPRAAIR
ncbi:MAG: hypothetical protein ACKPE6_01745, partial [Gammaproteobacteria bacterium]